MKHRLGFVSNSSSSSFIINLDSYPKTEDDIIEMFNLDSFIIEEDSYIDAERLDNDTDGWSTYDCITFYSKESVAELFMEKMYYILEIVKKSRDEAIKYLTDQYAEDKWFLDLEVLDPELDDLIYPLVVKEEGDQSQLPELFGRLYDSLMKHPRVLVEFSDNEKFEILFKDGSFFTKKGFTIGDSHYR